MSADRRKRWYPFFLLILLVSAGCDSDSKKEKGPNPYRRELRATKGLDPVAGAGATSRPATATQPDQTPASRPTPGSVGPPVLFVNKEALTVTEVLRPIRSRLEKRAATMSPNEYYAELERAVRNEMQMQVGLILIYQEAKKTIEEKEEEFYKKQADDEIQQIVNLEYGGLHAKFEQELNRQGISIADFRDRTIRRFVAMKTLKERFNALKEQPSRQELRKYYESHISEFTEEPKARMSLIEVRFAGGGSAGQSKSTAHDKIKRAQEELASEVPFAAVAKTYSEGVQARNGGAWDEIGPDSLRPRYKIVSDALFKMKAGETSSILEGPDAFFIVRCDDSTPGRQKSFEEAQADIQNEILDVRYAEQQNSYIRKLIEKAVILNENAFYQALLIAAPQPNMAKPQP